MSDLVNVEAERSVVGGLMLADRGIVWDVLSSVRPDDFTDPALGAVLAAIAELAKEDAPLDPISVGERLRRAGALNERLTPALLHTLVGDTPTGANAGYYADIVRDLAARRRLATAAQKVLDSIGAEGSVESLVEGARAEVDGVSRATVAAPARLGSRLMGLSESLDSDPTFHPTPWPELDRYIGGFRPGSLTVVAARPGVGKTIVGLQIARKLAGEGPVGFVSLEMSQDELLERVVSSVASISGDAMRFRQLTKTDWHSLAVARPAIEALDLYVRDDLNTPMAVVSFARSLHRKGGMQALVIDYLQLLRADEREEARHREIEAMTRAFKRLAQQLDIPVILLSQLNRSGSLRKGKAAKPRLEDLRDSGAIEQDADCVLLLHREDARGMVLEVNVAKNRHGRQGEFILRWEGPFARAVPRVWSPTALLEQEEVDDGERTEDRVRRERGDEAGAAHPRWIWEEGDDGAGAPDPGSEAGR